MTATNPCAPVFPNLLPSTLTPAGAAIQFFARNFESPLINQYDVILERQIMKNTVVSVAYLGSLGRNLPTFVDQNLRPLGTSTTYTVSRRAGNADRYLRLSSTAASVETRHRPRFKVRRNRNTTRSCSSSTAGSPTGCRFSRAIRWRSRPTRTRTLRRSRRTTRPTTSSTEATMPGRAITTYDTSL